ncbi:ribonuclease E/G [Rhodovulum sp. 12E13]|uniref:Rne/Rng family ribonuclease n=1 Tax=Rhodovulum sp. 12E13 TaxID=2203891 RepID=UPI000E1A4C88|nr:ribonuclease E/G [Rhodovulum sp. 12E13]RDC73412.1 ribonuclease E/G [Rhodovulum sp. 12E13]
MPKKMLIDATHAEETRVVVVDGNKVEEFDFETVNKRQLAGNIYLAKVTRVEPSLQAAFVDYGGNRHGFLAFSEIHPDYYQIPVADRQALLEEERAYAEAQAAEEGEAKPRRRRRPAAKSARAAEGDAVETREAPEAGGVAGMDVVEPGTTGAGDALPVSEPEAAEHESDGASADAPDTATASEGPGDGASHEGAPEAGTPHAEASDADENGDKPYAAVDHATELDSEIESVADEDVTEEIRHTRKPRPRRYKIQEVVKVRQIMLVQVVKEERGNKGAALTTYLSLAGRYCVLMPNTARGGGISRKITNAADRKKLKEIAGEIEVPEGAGLIIRTAGAKRTKTEIKRDYEYLKRLWEQIRDLTLKSVAPAPIYEEGNLIKRSIRDLYSREIDEVLVEGEGGYRVAKDFMKMIMPSHAKNVRHYADPMPLFARYQVESYLASMFNPTVQLKSGGYIVIGVTEALVAIDVNSGRATKKGSVEETALETNLEAAEEIARQLRLRDLAGLIVIDFIDMEERKNNAAVEKRFKDKLKTDRARIQVGRISGFGLLEMSRQRLRPGMLEATTQPCPACHGTGLLRSNDSLGLQILRQIEEEGVRGKSREVTVRCPVAIANFLMNQKREHIAQIEARYGLSVRIEGDAMMISPDFTIDRSKTATRAVPEPSAPVISVDTSDMPEMPEEDEADEARQDEATAPPQEGAGDESGPKKKRRRRRRRGRGSGSGSGEQPSAEGRGDEADGGAALEGDHQGAASAGAEAGPAVAGDDSAPATADAAPAPETAAGADEAEVAGTAEPQDEAPAEEKPKRTRVRRTSRGRKSKAAEGEAPAESGAAQAPAAAAPEPQPEPAPDAAAQEPEAASAFAPESMPEPAPQPEPAPAAEQSAAGEAADAPPEPAPAEPAPAESATGDEPAGTEPAEDASRERELATAGDAPEARGEDEPKPKKRGWWSFGR